MPQFHIRPKAQPDEVSLEIAKDGVTGSVVPPDFARGTADPRDLRLASAFHVAGALADKLGTDVTIVDSEDNVFFIEDPIPDLAFKRAH